MKKLTKLQRHTAYIIMHEEAKNYRIFKDGLCHLLYFRLGFKSSDHQWYFGDLIEQYLPELHYKFVIAGGTPPRTKEGWRERIELLQQCINETL